MEMNGAQKANKTTRDNGRWRWHCVYALWCPRCSFVFSPLFSTSAAVVVVAAVAVASCTAGHARKGRSICCKGAAKNCCAIASTVAWIFVSHPGECVAQSSSRQFTCILQFRARFFSDWRAGSVTQPCLIMLIYANNQCAIGRQVTMRGSERETVHAWGQDKADNIHTHAKQLSQAKTKRYKILASRRT